MVRFARRDVSTQVVHNTPQSKAGPSPKEFVQRFRRSSSHAHDSHVFIGKTDSAHPQGARLTNAQVKLRKKRTVVVELTPNIQHLHPDWGRKLQRRLAGKNVCITGWLLYDPAHPPQLGNTRGTLWEVHPITNNALLNTDGSCTAWVP